MVLFPVILTYFNIIYATKWRILIESRLICRLLCLGDLILLTIMSPGPIKGNKNDCRGFWWGVGLLLVGEGIKESLPWKEFLSPKALIFCFFLCQLRLRHKGFSALSPLVKEIALTSSIYCFHMWAVISLANGNETQNCNKWGHATEYRCSPLRAQSTHARSN